MALLVGSTIYDVAKEAGVSIATVSRFLNNPEKVNSETAQKIQSAVDELHYIPHGNAGTKAQRQMGRVGVLTPFFPAPSFVQRLVGITSVLRLSGYEMIIYTVDTPEQLNEYLHSIPFSKRLNGLIIMSMLISPTASQRLLRSGLEVVVIEHHNPLFSCVESDNVRGGALAAQHFLSKGYRSCGFIGEKSILPYSLQPGQMRLEGYRKTLEEAGLSLSPEHVLLGDLSVEDARRMGLEILRGPNRPRAIFTMSDLQAIGVMKAAKELGLSIPGDLAVIGFDDIDAADYVDLTTVSQSLNESGRVAAEMLLSRIKEPERPKQSVQIKVAIVERKTT